MRSINSGASTSVSDTLAAGRRFRTLCIVDDLNRECLATVVDILMLSGVRVLDELDRLILERDTPAMISAIRTNEKTITATQQRSAMARSASSLGFIDD